MKSAQPFIASYLLKRSLIVLLWLILIFGVLFFSHFESQTARKEGKSLYIFTWSDVITPEIVKRFESETGIRVYLDYYSSNEELLTKLKKSKASGYDLIIPSDYAVPLLAKENLLQTLKKDKIKVLSDINPILLGHAFDKNNIYSLPLQWDICGFGIDKDVFKDSANQKFTWDNLFNEEVINYKIAMTNDPVDAFCMAAAYLFGERDHFSTHKIEQIKNLLKRQRKHVEAYAFPRSDYVLGSKNAALSLTLSAYILRSSEYFPFIDFVIPEEKTFISIENIAIPKGAKNEEAIYAFINFFYRKDIMAISCNEYGIFPATLSVVDDLKYKEAFLKLQKKISAPDYKLFFSKHIIDEKELRNVWIELKS